MFSLQLLATVVLVRATALRMDNCVLSRSANTSNLSTTFIIFRVLQIENSGWPLAAQESTTTNDSIGSLAADSAQGRKRLNDVRVAFAGSDQVRSDCCVAATIYTTLCHEASPVARPETQALVCRIYNLR